MQFKYQIWDLIELLTVIIINSYRFSWNCHLHVDVNIDVSKPYCWRHSLCPSCTSADIHSDNWVSKIRLNSDGFSNTHQKFNFYYSLLLSQRFVSLCDILCGTVIFLCRIFLSCTLIKEHAFLFIRVTTDFNLISESKYQFHYCTIYI